MVTNVKGANTLPSTVLFCFSSCPFLKCSICHTRKIHISTCTGKFLVLQWWRDTKSSQIGDHKHTWKEYPARNTFLILANKYPAETKIKRKPVLTIKTYYQWLAVALSLLIKYHLLLGFGFLVGYYFEMMIFLIWVRISANQVVKETNKHVTEILQGEVLQ